MSMEQNQLTRDLYAAGYTREDHPSFVYWSDWQNFGYLFEALLKFIWETPCGLLVAGESSLGRGLACSDASFQGIDYCPENDNPLLRCPYERKDCPHSISGFPVPLCPCHTTGKRYSYEQSAERVESERSERQHRQYMEITGGAYCACVVGGNGYDGGHVEVQYDVEQCIRCRCQNPVCVIRKQKRDLSRANIFYDVRRTWITRIGFLEEKKVQVTKGERVFPHPVAQTDAEIWLETKKAHFNPLWSSSAIDSPHLTPEDRRQTFFSKMHRQYGEYDYFEFHYDVENIRIAKSEQRDLLQDLRDVADGLEVVHAVDLKKEQAAKKRESRQRRKEQKERRLNKRSADMEHKENPYYGMPIPAYKKGYRLFANSHLPEKITVFGVGQRNQDIYNADELDRLLGKTVITRTFEEVTGKDIRRIHQMPIPFLPEEREVYNIVLKEFYRIQREYYSSTGNSRKDALMRLIQQITLLLRISAAPDCMKEYEGETPLKEMAVVEALARWPEEVVAIGVRHTTVLDRYAAAIREYLPERPLFVVTGSTVTFAKRRALRDILRDSRNGILLCTQQSLPSSVNFEFVNKIIIPEMHYNNAGMSQFYMRFVRYTSTEKKDLYFPIYIGSLESNLMQMVLAKEKLTMFMKGQDADMDEIYAKFGVDYDLLSTLMTRETDDEGHLRIHWGEQKIA